MLTTVVDRDGIVIKVWMDLHVAPQSLGCHASIVNNVSLSITQIPFMALDRKTAAWGAYTTIDQWYASFAQNKKIQVPAGLTVEKLFEVMPEGWKTGRGLTFDDVSEKAKKELFANYVARLKLSGCVIFCPVMNYGRESRGGQQGVRAGSYITDLLLKYAMEHAGGSWFGLPAMVNTAHSAGWGGHTIYQPVIWIPDPAHSYPIKASRFEVHPKGAGKYGYLHGIKEFMQLPAIAGSTKVKEFDKLSERALRDKSFNDLRYHADKIKEARK